ncbi:MAG: sulfotransferase [Chitinophagaceae bacterium]|nr:sulfotransferase [Chitinophagaceae bacterium]
MILDLSGYMFSGKASVSDILSEFDNIYVPNNREEFDLLRISGGLIDLKNSIDDWSPIRTDAALHKFETTVNKLSRDVSFVENFFNIGWGYKNRYENIIVAAKEFSKNITELEREIEWPYDEILYTSTEQLKKRLNHFKFSKRIYAKLLAQTIYSVYNFLIFNKELDKPKTKYRLISKNKFNIEATKFIDKIIWNNINKSKYKIVVLHNALEPFNPAKNLDLLGPNSKCIVVDRDPRDIFITAVTHQKNFNDNVEFYKKIASADNIDNFIIRYNIYRKNVITNDRVLRLDFKELILNYEEVINKLCHFLEIEKKSHINRMKYFDPNVSKVNLNLWTKPQYDKFKNEFELINSKCKKTQI